MVLIPASEFLMGTPEPVLDQIASSQQYDRSWFEDESPQHLIALPAFEIDVHPVTNAEFESFVDATAYRSVAEQRGFGLVYCDYWLEVAGASWKHPCGPQAPAEDRGSHPVVHMALEDANAYASWAGKRLATEPEWELAARGSAFRVWPWGDTFRGELANTAERTALSPIDDLAGWRQWWLEFSCENRLPGTTPVGFFGDEASSPHGLSDVAGNVLEWTGSSYLRYDPERKYDEVFEAVVDRYAVMRGGSWMHLRYQVRCCERFAATPNGYSSFATGFRCARDVGDSMESSAAG